MDAVLRHEPEGLSAARHRDQLDRGLHEESIHKMAARGRRKSARTARSFPDAAER